MSYRRQYKPRERSATLEDIYAQLEQRTGIHKMAPLPSAPRTGTVPARTITVPAPVGKRQAKPAPVPAPNPAPVAAPAPVQSALSFADQINARIQKGHHMTTNTPAPAPVPAPKRTRTRKNKAEQMAALTPATPVPAPNPTPDPVIAAVQDSVSAAEALLAKVRKDPKVRKTAAPRAKRDPATPRTSKRGEELHPGLPEVQEARTDIYRAISALSVVQVDVDEYGLPGDIPEAKKHLAKMRLAYLNKCDAADVDPAMPSGGGNPAKVQRRAQLTAQGKTPITA